MSLRGHQAGVRPQESLDRYLIATLGGMWMAFSAETVDGLLTDAESGLEGVVTVQGQEYAPVDLAVRLGLDRDGGGPDARIVLLAQGAVRGSVRVARVQGLVECERRQVLPLPQQFRGAERDWYAGLLPLGDGVAAVLRTSWVLEAGEMAMAPGSAVQERRPPLPTDTVPAAMGGRGSC